MLDRTLDTPIFNNLWRQTPPKKRPTFQPALTHQDFLVQHHFTTWLHETRVKVDYLVKGTGLGWPE